MHPPPSPSPPQTSQNVFSSPWTYDQDEATGSVMRLEKCSSPFILIKNPQHGKFYSLDLGNSLLQVIRILHLVAQPVREEDTYIC